MSAWGDMPGPLTAADLCDMLTEAGAAVAELEFADLNQGVIQITGPANLRAAAYGILFHAGLDCSPYPDCDEYRRR